MKRKQKDKQILYRLIWQGNINESDWYYNRDGEGILPENLNVLQTVIQKITCYSEKSLEELTELAQDYPLDNMNFFTLYQFLKQVGCKLKVEPIYHKGAIYCRVHKKKTQHIVLLNSEYESDGEGYQHTYVIAPLPINLDGTYDISQIEEHIEVLHRAFKQEYLLEYEYFDKDSFQYNFYTDELLQY